MNQIKLFFLLISATLSSLYASSSQTLPWNITVYMEASAGHLFQAALKNLDELMRNAPENAYIFAFLHAQGDEGWLYRITKNNLHKIAILPCFDSVAQTLIDVMTLTTQQGPALHYGLVLWNHGYGVLEPIYDEYTHDWSVPYDGMYNVGCSLKRSHNIHRLYHRGICINNQQTFLSNQDMIEAFDIICNDLLHGNKLAFCGMDLCKGAMFEHAYQLHDYVKYLVASQECELLDGWPYDMVLQMLNDNPNAHPRELVTHIVDSFDNYYQEYTERNTYTLSALDLSLTNILKDNVDAVAQTLTLMMQQHEHVSSVIQHVRTQCNAFCDAPMYCDLYQWYSTLLTTFDACPDIDHRAPMNNAFRLLLLDGMNIMNTITVARCAGQAAMHANGCSIYFPQFAIDPSYMNAPFAQDSYWLDFLQTLLA
jgi:hypothetical protein